MTCLQMSLQVWHITKQIVAAGTFVHIRVYIGVELDGGHIHQGEVTGINIFVKPD